MVTFNGRITLPPHVRKQLGLRTGDSVEFVEIGKGRFALAPRTAAAEDAGSASLSDPRGWMPKLEFASGPEKPGFELDEAVR
jgi:AbrB family looped-hinge helix DNA binding protein